MQINAESLYYFRSAPNLGKLNGENLITVKLANYLKEMTLTGKCKFIWFHPANEGKNGPYQANMMRNCGKLAGVADFIFISPNTHLFLELKSEKGKLSESQKFFKSWCEEMQCNYEIANSFENAVKLLNQYKIV